MYNPAAPRAMPAARLPEGFVWGCATSAYQIEGAAEADGRAPSVWDAFCERPDAIADGRDGRRACNHYDRLEEDLDIMASLGIGSYRFSVAWPRVIPDGTGPVNERGLAFYDRLVDGLLARNIRPCLTCFHWDLPQVLEARGGWSERSTAEAFGEYCAVLGRRFGDRVDLWCTVNEPWCVWSLGHAKGVHAPGKRLVGRALLQVSHHLNLAHGLGLQALRAAAPRPIRVGLVHNAFVAVPFFEGEGCIDAARAQFERDNGWFLGPALKGCYPEDQWAGAGADAPEVRDGDLEAIGAPTDYLGLNVYMPTGVVRAGRRPEAFEPHFPRTGFSWPVEPDSLYWAIRFASELYGPQEILVTENGAAYPDAPGPDGRVEDHARISYLRGHIRAVARAAAEGFPVRGYYAWSLMDNFEWAHGFSQRFGLVHVDFETLKRTPKASAEWFAAAVRANGA